MSPDQRLLSFFRPNADGSWTSIRSVELRGLAPGAVGIGPGVTFRPAAPFIGLQVADELHAAATRLAALPQ